MNTFSRCVFLAAVFVVLTLLPAVAEARPGAGGRGAAGRGVGNPGANTRGPASPGGAAGIGGPGRAAGSPTKFEPGGAATPRLQGFSNPQGAASARAAIGPGAPGQGEFRRGPINQQPFGQGRFGAQAGQAPHNGLRVNNFPGAVQFPGGVQPFTPAWYADHPNAWQNANPHADAWAAVSATSAAAWMGWAALESGPGSSTVVNDTTVYANAAPRAAVDPRAAALADAGTEWLSLGVFSLSPPTGRPQHTVQLAVNRAGEVRGAYYDDFTGSSVNVTGLAERSSQRARWTFESNSTVVFSAPLATLTSAGGEVTVTSPRGEETWVATRLNAPQ